MNTKTEILSLVTIAITSLICGAFVFDDENKVAIAGFYLTAGWCLGIAYRAYRCRGKT